jgi:hypothetical protein
VPHSCSTHVVLNRSSILSYFVMAAVTLTCVTCSWQDERLQQHQEKFESLGSTMVAIGEAWLSGSVSGTYAVTALEQTFHLVEQERASLTASPQALVDPRGARLSEAADRLSRLLAVMIHDVRAANAAAVRQHLAEIPVLPEQP